MLEALGLIEVVGLVGAIEAADTASKAADVKVIGYELTKGSGMVLVKIVGGVSAVKSAVDAASMAAERVSPKNPARAWMTATKSSPEDENA